MLNLIGIDVGGTKCAVTAGFAEENHLEIIDKKGFATDISKSADEMVELFDNTKLLLVFNDDVVDEFDYDFTKVSKIISFACCENDTTKIADIVVPVK